MLMLGNYRVASGVVLSPIELVELVNTRMLPIESFAHLVTYWIQLSEGISKHQQLKKKSAATALNTVLASAHTQTTY
jgi:hypothetical protein